MLKDSCEDSNLVGLGCEHTPSNLDFGHRSTGRKLLQSTRNIYRFSIALPFLKNTCTTNAEAEVTT
jgi:hypothetical protein